MKQIEKIVSILNQDLLRINNIKGFEVAVDDYDFRRSKMAAWDKINLVYDFPDSSIDDKRNFIGLNY
jgi:hypothetical protein